MTASVGRYELVRPLARGGMADVYLARRRVAAGIEKQLVLKRIRPDRARDPRFVEMFIREARLSVGLVHANIVPVFDFGRLGDTLFLAMEYVHGRDLGAVLERAAPLDPLVAAHVALEACRALDYAQRKPGPDGEPLGLVHRDVTPRNVLLSHAGEVKLVDFGVAVLQDDAGRSGRLRGTPGYMAPEQARGEPVDGRADLFGLGLVLYEAVTGARAYRGGDLGALLVEARDGRVPELPPSVPPPLADIIRRATRPAREDRFPDARAMQQALDRYVVAERAARADPRAPSELLAELLASQFSAAEPPDDAPGFAGDLTPKAVTFMDDGDEEVMRALVGDEHPQSMSETVGEDPPREPRRRAPWLLLGAVVLAAGGGGWFLARPRPLSAPELPSLPPPRRAEPPPERPVVVPAPDAAVPAVKPEPRPRPATHVVRINARPWARVFVDGRFVDETPFEVSLPAGTHRLRFVNPTLGVTRDIVIEVPHPEPVVEDLAP